MKNFYPLLLVITVHGVALSQMKGKTSFNASIETIISSDSVKPFWSRTNKFGTVPLKGNMYALDLSFEKAYDSLFTKDKNLRKWDFGYGARAVGGLNDQKAILLLPEAYVKVRWKHLEFYGGRRQEIFGLVDSTATSGSYIWSGNAMPLPKLQVHTPGYLPISKSGFLSMKAGISHGWFADNGVVKNHWLHQKWLYGKIGRSDSKVQFSAGVNHQVMWGGYSEILKDVGGEFPPTVDGFLTPNALYAYPYILIPFLHKIKPQSPDKVSAFDAGNVIGNQLGSVDLSFKITLKTAEILVYAQQPYDFARSLYHLNNIEDGLYGISYHTGKRIVKKICLEYFNSRSQGRYRFGKYQTSNGGEIDSYFFHGQYQSWSNQGDIIGNPFIINNYFMNAQTQFSNRVYYYYGNIQGEIGLFDYAVKYVWSQNLGTYSRPINLNQQSLNVMLSKNINRQIRTALDFSLYQGYLYPNSRGVNFKVHYHI